MRVILFSFKRKYIISNLRCAITVRRRFFHINVQNEWAASNESCDSKGIREVAATSKFEKLTEQENYENE